MPKIPEGAKMPSDRLEAEAKSLDTDAPTVHEFAGEQFSVLPFLDWDKSAMTAINRLDFNGWAAAALVPEDVDRFVRAKATARETMHFMKAVTEGSGADMGEFFAS